MQQTKQRVDGSNAILDFIGMAVRRGGKQRVRAKGLDYDAGTFPPYTPR